MSSVPFPSPPAVFRGSLLTWAAFGLAAALLYAVFRPGIEHLLATWTTREEYSYGPMIPLIVAFLVWQRKDRLERLPADGAWTGAAFVALGVLARVVGEMSWSPLVVNYGLLAAIWGLALAYLGWRGAKVIAGPLAILAFMVPLPEFLLVALSQELQLFSSRLGVALIRVCDISVYLEGNVIDLGTMKLQVVEACNGLRYLFPLMTLGFVAAYFFKGAMWKRALVFLASIPITVLMNSARIALVGVTVEHFGREAAEGLLHDFEGLVVFLGCVLILVALMGLLARVGSDRLPLRSAFGLDFPAPAPAGARIEPRALPAPFVAGCAVLALAWAAHAAAPERTLVRPERREFAAFPLELDGWRGRAEPMAREHLEVLRPDDYLMADYLGPERRPVNLFVGYFATQTRDAAPHSPRACLPAAGWEIERLERRRLETVLRNGAPLDVNRAVIRRGESAQLVYYWLQHGPRTITNEYVAKFYVFWDSVTRHRADGALVRLVTPLATGEDPARADERLAGFAARIVPLLPAYLPE
jgi:exosortase D (VPLPA-CTERM-specific)